jgi:hypothetical protein
VPAARFQFSHQEPLLQENMISFTLFNRCCSKIYIYIYIYIDLMNSILLDLLEWVAWLTWSLFNQWQISTCYIKSCLKPARAVFSIDGLWPSSYSRKTPSNCCAGSNFVPQKVLHLFLVFHTKYHSKASTKRYTGHGSNVIYKVKLCLFQRD